MERKANLAQNKVFFILIFFFLIYVATSQSGILKAWKLVDSVVKRNYPDEETRLLIQNANIKGVNTNKDYLTVLYKL